MPRIEFEVSSPVERTRALAWVFITSRKMRDEGEVRDIEEYEEDGRFGVCVFWQGSPETAEAFARCLLDEMGLESKVIWTEERA